MRKFMENIRLKPKKQSFFPVFQQKFFFEKFEKKFYSNCDRICTCICTYIILIFLFDLNQKLRKNLRNKCTKDCAAKNLIICKKLQIKCKTSYAIPKQSLQLFNDNWILYLLLLLLLILLLLFIYAFVF